MVVLNILYYICTVKQTKTKKMNTFNTTLTQEEATKLFQFKGATMFPKTEHNLKMMALVIDLHLKSLRK